MLLAVFALLLASACARPSSTPVAGTGIAPSSESNAPPPTSAVLPITSADISWGQANAPVTIVAFLDFECPFCAQSHSTLLELLEAYGPNKLRLIVKHAPLPFHQRGIPAARATQAVFQLTQGSGFLAYVKRMFEHPGALHDSNLTAWAGEQGIDADRFKAETEAESVRSKLTSDLELARTVGVNGVPAFYINGAAIVGARPKADFVALIDHELRAGEELAKRGVLPDAVYAERVNVNWDSQSEESKPYEDVAYKVPLDTSPALGPKTAGITIVEFADFECPFCQRAHQTIEALMAKYPNQIRWVMKHNPLPFHPLAEPAAMTALEVRRSHGDTAYWQALRKFYAAPELSRELLEQVARDFGVAITEQRPGASDLSLQLRADRDLAMDLEASGTPHFFINGRRMAGAQPFAVFEEVVQQELKKAATLGSVQEPYVVLQSKAQTPAGANKHNVPAAPSSAPVLGDPNAPVVIQMFSDLECAYCARVVPTLRELRAKYPGKIKLVWRHLPLPFHKNARRAAAAALEAQSQLGPAGFWQMAEKLMGLPNAFLGEGRVQTAQTWTADSSPSAIEAFGKQLGLDGARLETALETGVHEPAIQADQRLAGSLGVQGTPAFFVGPYALEGAQPLARFDRLVRRVLEEAK